MLSLSHPPKPPSFFPYHQNPRLTTENRSRLQQQQQQQQQQQRRLSVSVSASAAKLPFSPPPSSPPGEVYQPFRPPPSSPLPARFRSLSVVERLDVLRLRLGLWHEYAPLISALSRDGFTPSSIEDATGIPGAEQNRLVVAHQVRDSLVASAAFPPDLLAFFDYGGGPELLYELRFLSAAQRAASAARVAERRLDPRGARDLARAVKDFPRRRADDGWRAFSPDSPADCLAFAFFRQSREALDHADRLAALRRALDTADTDSARARIAEEIERRADGSKEEDEEEEAERRAAVPVLRLRYGEVAEAAAVVLLPAVRAAEGAAGVAAAPARLRAQGELGVVAAETAWGRWAVLPGWAPVMEASETAVAVEMEDGRALPWRSILAAAEEAVLVVADRGRRKVEQEGGAYVVDREGRLVVERGKRLMETGVAQAVATVVLVVRPPREEDDQLSEEDWE
ncbi:rubisco accumulation factor 1, chloroplastic-like [Ananas comosus]|uniref:Rubisco accumulation factor 1, chloroplastic-like n=1 Tax=Ananas comosus TaxID=4615 RepID=A0A6P5FGL0_ANACO|nr:rubisco accumulation factor 1, chloroplastic-like [Ananas comosus]